MVWGPIPERKVPGGHRAGIDIEQGLPMGWVGGDRKGYHPRAIGPYDVPGLIFPNVSPDIS